MLFHGAVVLCTNVWGISLGMALILPELSRYQCPPFLKEGYGSITIGRALSRYMYLATSYLADRQSDSCFHSQHTLVSELIHDAYIGRWIHVDEGQ